MRSTDQFRRQHEELAALGAELLRAVTAEAAALDVVALRCDIARFIGKLRVHASMENEALYPRLHAHADVAVQAKARALFDEVSGIYAAAWTYQEKWRSAEAVAADVAGFARETKRLLKTLYLRMDRENRELYPLVDAADG
jgi:hypothetical protein